jgi:hypothetical protein
VLFVPGAGDLDLMLLYDSAAHRAVAVELLGAEGMRFQVLDPEAGTPSVELRLGGDGYFGPTETLEALGISDAELAERQAHSCRQPCFQHGHLPACAACTAVSLLQSLRSRAPAASGTAAGTATTPPHAPASAQLPLESRP